MQYKLAAYHFYINRMLTLSMTSQVKQQEWDLICTVAMNNVFPMELIHTIKNQLTKIHNTTERLINTERRITFTYHSQPIRKATNLLKHTNLNKAFRRTNTVYHQLQNTTDHINLNASGVYRLQCGSCSIWYIGQCGRSISVRYREHTRYSILEQRIQSQLMPFIFSITDMNKALRSNPYMLHTCSKGNFMNHWETFYIQLHELNLLIDEQQPQEHNPLYALSSISHQTTTHHIRL
jgi:hypothetical protein